MKGGISRSTLMHLKEDGFISEEKRHRSTQACSRQWYMLWVKCVLLATAWIISIFIASCISAQRQGCEALSSVVPTELQSVQTAIELQKVRFSGTLIATYWDPETPRYTGEPSEELDARWHALIQPDGVDLRGEDADSVQGKTFEKPGGWSIVSIDVFHQLHCLNMLRQAIRPDYYTKHDPEPAYTTHIHHCIDHLRQALMCHVDVTPIPVLWAEKEDRPLNDFQVEHTCRNFWKVKDWAIERDAHKHKYKGL
ncbi:hypothetical protein N7491_006020 [Penicillium cf. griseofulvum]|uniref:Tat pathway signal sequence n=1 Tax=Penicillium cf. griseofulvum TaxID=2972120 RepID=A0A9W9IY02_9EURO|nr:hypothetical protein N7472_010949 [Penicillium cf. griseofulvum]KAJ5429004.1 hypothetical protein N7491_006020 [Penicillium cf. griseofulvum]KAJ5437205.1 hypothetical protein N7445_008090 [Penicillium cf. griseofulvum]